MLFKDHDLLTKSGYFDVEYYLASNADVAASQTDPLIHYLERGAAEGRDPSAGFDTAYYLEQCRRAGETPPNPLLHFVTGGALRGLKPNAAGDDVIARIAARSPALKVAAEVALCVERCGVETHGDGSRRLTVEGWAAAAEPIAAISLFAGNKLIGHASHGLARPDVAVAYVGLGDIDHSGFELKVDPLPEDLRGKVQLVLVVRLAGGKLHRQRLQVALNAAPAVAPGRDDASVFSARRPGLLPLRLEVEQAAVDARGMLRVSGWAACFLGVEAVRADLDGSPIGSARYGEAREDVATAYPEYPGANAAGFSLVTNVSRFGAGIKFLTVRVHVPGGVSRAVVIPLELPAELPALEPDADPQHAPIAPSPTGQSTCAINLDRPRVVNGRLESALTSSLSIEGWAMANAGVQSIDVAVDGESILKAHYGLRRDDVAAAFPLRRDALNSGFGAIIPGSTLPKGEHLMSVCLVDKSGGTATVSFKFQVGEVQQEEGPWSLRRKISQAEVDLQMRVLSGMRWRPEFRLLLSLDGSRAAIEKARLTLASLRRQVYGDWSLLVLMRDASVNAPVNAAALRAKLLAGFDDIAARVSFGRLRSSLPLHRLGEAASARPLYHAVLCGGDELGCDALLELALAAGADRSSDFFYSDERRVSPVSRSMEPYFKPGWSPDLLLATNYIGRLWCASAALVERSGLRLRDWLEHGDYELVLRLTERAAGVAHLSKVLCQRSGIGPDAAAVERKAIARALQRRGVIASISRGCVPGTYSVKRKKRTRGLVSIIIPTCAARGHIRTCLDSLRKKTAYRNFEIICIENIPAGQQDWKTWLRHNADKVISTAEPFNWSRYNNLCVEQASGEFLLFLNDDVEIVDPQWLDVLLEHAERPEVGAVGPQLLYADGSVQHAGLTLAGLGKARHLFRYAQADDPGYFGLALTDRNVIGVTGACLLTRREVFEQVGRFDESHSIINNDVDYCLKTWNQGYLNLFTARTRLIHHEMSSRGELGEHYDSGAFDSAWRLLFLKGDPYLNRHLSRLADDLSPELEPVAVVCPGYPLFKRQDVRSILVQKLDHIGDCITALPALRRLKRLFPSARLTVLVNQATRAIWEGEADVDEIIVFDFFHTLSGLGKRQLPAAAFEQLRARLRQDFDLAVDLRKSPDTRHLLQCAEARFFAGFDSAGQFPWLDVALEWEGNPRYKAKRQHIADDLLNLVEVIAASCAPERRTTLPISGKHLSLPGREQQRIFSSRVVCIHPASGNELRQWPIRYFAELIDLLIAEEAVNVVVIGSQDEQQLAAELFGSLHARQQVFNLVGALKLAELPALISRCALFIGNNSGPHHLAAALGVPTIGIHSGVVDAREWGPLGPNAVAIRRDMSCSPCYSEKISDCPRNLACLKGLGPGEVLLQARRLLAIRPAAGKRPRPPGGTGRAKASRRLAG